MRAKTFIDVPRIHFSDNNCRINRRKRPGIGLLVDKNFNPILEPTDFLISRAVVKGEQQSSVMEYGRILRMFWEFLATEKIHWLAVNDNVLVMWRDMMESGQRITKGQKVRIFNDVEGYLVDAGTINIRIGLVFSFYKWAMENERAPRDIIGTAGENQLFAITVKRSEKGKWSWPYLLRNPALPPPYIPIEKDINKLDDSFDLLYRNDHATRNRLIALWFKSAGLRGIEVASLKKNLIPSYDDIQNLMDKSECYELDFSPKRKGVKTKGGNNSRYIDIDPRVLEITKDYIEIERKDIVVRAKLLAKKKGTRYKEPDEIFLSLTDGSPLSKHTIQNEFTAVCKQKDLKLKAHWLRRYYTMKVVSDLYFDELRKVDGDVRKVDINTLILYAQQKLGHKHASTTIARYLNIVKLQFMSKSLDQKAAFLERRKEIDERLIVAKQRELSEVKAQIEQLGLDGIKEAVKRNDKNKLMKLVKSILAKG